jgi:hypothetical protein
MRKASLKQLLLFRWPGERHGGYRMKGFMEFIRKQGVVGLAIGFIVGVA